MSNSLLFSLRAAYKSRSWKRTQFFALALLIILFGVGCRPSQQTRRTTAAAAARNNAAGGKSTDSLLIVQSHLVDLIDTMSTALAVDRMRIKNLEIEVARLRSLIEQQRVQSSSGYRLPSMSPPMPPQTQPSMVPSSAKTFSAPPSGGIPPGTPLPSSGTGGSTSPERYARALQLFNEARYEEAMNAFDELSRDDAASPYSPNYLYWRGESQYALSRYTDAVASFQSVVDGYATSPKADDSQFKIGESYEKLGNKDAAKAAYGRLLAQYPETEYRSRVEGRLKRLQ